MQMVREWENDRAKTPAWLRKIKSNSLIEWFNKWPTARQNLDERHQPPTWLRVERERNIEDRNFQKTTTADGIDTEAAVGDNPSTSGIFLDVLDARETGMNSRPFGKELVDFTISPHNNIASLEENKDKRASPGLFYFGQVRDSGKNTFGINIKELRQSRRRTIICTMLGLGLILLVSAPVIVIIILAKS